MKFKKIILLFLIIILSACSKKDDKNIKTQTIEVEKKPISSKLDIKTATFASSVTVDHILNDKELSYRPEKINDLSQIESMNFDVAIIPAHEIFNLYNKTNGAFKIAAITLVNNIKIISDKQISSPKDLYGMTLMITSINQSFDNVIESKLSVVKRLFNLKIEFYKDQNDLIENMKKSKNFIATLSEPFYTKATEKGNYYLYDINKTMSMIPNNKINSDGDIISEVIIVNNQYLKDNKESFDKFLKKFKESQDTIDKDSIVSQDIINEYDITNEEAINIYNSLENCFIESDTMKGVFEVYMDKLDKLDKNIINGLRPSEDIYYIK